jgi:hypothetical protein
MPDYGFTDAGLSALSGADKKAPEIFDIQPFREYDYSKKYFKEGEPVLVGLTSGLTKVDFVQEMFPLPEKYVKMLNGGEKKIDTRDLSYPLV